MDWSKLEIVAEAYEQAWNQWKDILVLSVPLLVVGAIGIALQWQALRAMEEAIAMAAAPSGTWLNLGLSITTTILAMSFFAALMRRFANAPQTTATIQEALSLGREHLYFIGIYLLSVVALVAATAFVTLAAYLGNIVGGSTVLVPASALGALIFYIYIACRLASAIAAAALRRPGPIALGWRLSKGQAFKIFIATLLMMIPVIVLMLLLSIPFFLLVAPQMLDMMRQGLFESPFSLLSHPTVLTVWVVVSAVNLFLCGAGAAFLVGLLKRLEQAVQEPVAQAGPATH